jgi:hypothetical protein
LTVKDIVESLRKNFGKGVAINLVELDPTGIDKLGLQAQACNIFKIRSNPPFPLTPDDLFSNLDRLDYDWKPSEFVYHAGPDGLLNNTSTILKVLNVLHRR